jgi:hypothetical protein
MRDGQPREEARLSYSLGGARALHALLLAVGMFGACRLQQTIQDPGAALSLLPVDFVPPSDLPPGGGDGL